MNVCCFVTQCLLQEQDLRDDHVSCPIYILSGSYVVRSTFDIEPS